LDLISSEFEKRGSGIIIGISSVAGDRGRASNYIYGSAKAAFTTYLSGLRNRFSSKGIQVITVKPGYVNTKMTENYKLPKILTAQPIQVGTDIWKAFAKKRDIIYSLWFWRWIMVIIKLIPEFLFKKLKL
jgi:short-subunit dehydrogenase